MKEKPILFSSPMVRAILEGRKVQTRRVISNMRLLDGRWYFGRKYSSIIYENDDRVRAPDGAVASEYAAYHVGDRLWVRETWQTHCDKDGITPRDLPPDTDVQYPATCDHWVSKKRPGIHMPRWASRITLLITDIRIQRLLDISEEDAVAEGMQSTGAGRYWIAEFDKGFIPRPSASAAFLDLWSDINGDASRVANTWVYALTFEVLPATNSATRLKSAQRDTVNAEQR